MMDLSVFPGTFRQLTARNIVRMRKILEQDLGEDVRALVEHHLGVLPRAGGIISRKDYDILMTVLRTHDKSGTLKGSNGWIKIVDSRTKGGNVFKHLTLLSNRGNERAKELLATIVDGRIKKELKEEALALVSSHNMMRRRSQKSMMNTSHAIDVACQTCENLTDVDFSEIPLNDRKKLISRLGSSAIVLMEVQSKLMEKFE